MASSAPPPGYPTAGNAGNNNYSGAKPDDQKAGINGAAYGQPVAGYPSGYPPQQQGYPQQGGYQHNQGYPPQQGGYPQQQGGYPGAQGPYGNYPPPPPMYVQQPQRPNQGMGGAEGCLAACLAVMCCCLVGEALF